MNGMWANWRGVLTLAAGLALVAPGCKDNSDDPPNLYVISVVPGDQQTNVPTGSNIVLRFSTAVDLTSTGSNQILLVDQSNSVQPISVAYGASAEFLVVTPVTPLSPGLTYGLAVREQVRSDLGELIEAPFSMLFATGSSISTIPGFPPFLTPNPAPPNTGAPGTFTVTGQLNTPRARHTATRLQSGDVLITGGASPLRVSAGGTTLRSAEVYSPTSGTWRTTTGNGGQGMFYARYGHNATLLPSGKVLITGGWDERAVWDSAELYDPVTDTFAPTQGKMVVPLTFHTSTLLANGNVLNAGGFGPNGIDRGMDIFDAPTGTFMQCQNFMNRFRCYHASVLLGDGQTVLHTGGIVPWPGLGPQVTSACDTYLPDLVNGPGTQGLVSPTGFMADQRMNHTLTLMTTGLTAGLVIVTGGATGFITAEVYDANMPISGGNKGAFALVADNMSRGRRAHTANLIENGPDVGKLVLIGGTPQNPTAGVLYTAPHSWASTESHSCTLCASNVSAEIFDPFGFGQALGSPWKGIDVTGRFDWTRDALGNQTLMAGVPLNPANNGGRYYHTATTLRSGHVLVAGGWDCPWCFPLGTQSGPETALQTTELYNP